MSLHYQDLENYCLRFAVHHLTAVVQTESFAKLDEATLKQFIARVAEMGAFRYWSNLSLIGNPNLSIINVILSQNS